MQMDRGVNCCCDMYYRNWQFEVRRPRITSPGPAFFYMVILAQLAERLIVVQEAIGSNPIFHPGVNRSLKNISAESCAVNASAKFESSS